MNEDDEKLALYKEFAEKAHIPEHMLEAVANYIVLHRRPGDFLEAFLQNDLRGTFERADSVNQIHILDYIKFFYNEAPSLCWGSKEKMEAWIKEGA
jgi:hypothetical protein